MKKQKYYVTYTPDEIRIVLFALNQMRNELIEEGRYTDYVDELFLKVANAPVKKR